jgi:hypothetical protein
MLLLVEHLAKRHAYIHLHLCNVSTQCGMQQLIQTSQCVTCTREVRLTSRRAANDLRRGRALAERRNDDVRLLGRLHLASTRDPAFRVVHANSRW